MKRFSRILFTCYGIAFLLCGSAVSIGRLQSQPELLPRLGKCDDVPCYLDIVPGKTTWNEAQAIVKNMPELKFDPSTKIAYSPSGRFDKMQFLVSEEGIIAGIELVPARSSVNVGNVIAQLGYPCAAIQLGIEEIALRYPGMAFFSVMNESDGFWTLEPTSPITQITLLASVQPCGSFADNDGSNKWRGFRRYPK